MYESGGAKKIAGFSLIELMIAVTLGLLVLAAVTAVMISTITTNSANLNMIRLDQDLRNIMLLMTRDIRRAGSWNDTRTPTAANPRYDIGRNRNCNPFMQQATVAAGCPSPAPATAATDLFPSPTITITPPATSASASVNSNCITYTYDFNGNGIFETSNPDERFGFRLDNGAIRMRHNGSACTDAASSWGERITDPSLLTITALNFTVNATANVIPGSNVTPIASGGSNAQIVARDVTIRVTGRISIGGNQTAERTTEQTVRVRNDRYIPGT
jgi:prepilin peptidase dependent protein B